MSRHGHRFYIEQPLSVGLRLSIPEEQSRQIGHVLRLRTGDAISLFNGDGNDYVASIIEISRSTVTVEIDRCARGAELPGPPLHLALAMIKPDRFEWAMQKVTELGVARIIPMSTEFCVISLGVDREERRRQRWARIVTEASEQSGRCTVPEVTTVTPFENVIAAATNAQVVLLWEGESTAPLTAMAFDRQRPLVLMVGPEGGFSPAEIEIARGAGVKTVSLGRLILRSETAAVAAVAMMVGREISHDF